MNTSIQDFRLRAEKGAKRFTTIPGGIDSNRLKIGNIDCEWLIPSHADQEKVILYMHGGGYVAGSIESHRGFIAKLAGKTGVSCLLFDYRLAPEHPFPAALEDSLEVYKWLISDSILLAGDSAGGGLCLALLLKLKEKQLPLPFAAMVISPWTDLTCSSDSYRTKNKVSAAPLNSWNVFSKYYVGDRPANDPFISPLFGDLHGLPPLFINAGEDDELYEDGEKFYLKAREVGVDVVFRPGKNMIHCYPVFAPIFKEATEALEEIVGFIRKHLRIS